MNDEEVPDPDSENHSSGGSVTPHGAEPDVILAGSGSVSEMPVSRLLMIMV